MRIYEDNPLECPKCHQAMQLVAFITDPDTIYRILKHLGLPTRPPVICEAEETPQLEFWELKREVYRADIDLTLVIDESCDPPHPDDGIDVYYAD